MCGSMKLMARNESTYPSVIDEPAPEETIKFKATEDVIPTEELAEEIISEREERDADAPEENGAEENANPIPR